MLTESNTEQLLDGRQMNTTTGREKQAGAKRKFDAVEDKRERSSSPQGDLMPPSAAEAVSKVATPAPAPAEAVSNTDDSPMLTAKGRRMILQDLTYRIDAAALEAYAETSEAKSTRASCDESKARAKLTEHELIRRFLDGGRVKRLPDGTAICTFSYAASDIGEELWRQGLLENGGRLYPDKWPSVTDFRKSCATAHSERSTSKWTTVMPSTGTCKALPVALPLVQSWKISSRTTLTEHALPSIILETRRGQSQ